MGKTNKKAKEELIRLYGAECFIERLHLRQDTNRKYKSKGQYKRMKQLTYHHILEKSKGGKSTKENGALLSDENHQWFNKQSPQAQEKMNEAFQELKKKIDNARECKIELVDTLNIDFDIKVAEISFSDEREAHKEKFNRAKIKKETRKIIEDELEL